MRITSDIIVVVPVLNEEDSVARVISKIPKSVDGKRVKVVAVDGGSTDNTVKVVKSLKVPLLFQEGAGKGKAILQASRQCRCKVLVTIDGDGTYDASRLGDLVRPVLKGECDMVVGTRLKSFESGALTQMNYFGNKMFAFMLRLYNIKLEDILSGYRAMDKGMLDRLPLSGSKFEFETELTLESIWAGWRVKEIPMFYKKRLGRPKLRPIRDGFTIFKWIVIMIRDINPIGFFWTMGAILFALASFPAGYVLYEKLVLGNILHLPSTVLAALLALIATQLVIFGIMADMNLRSMRRFERMLQKKEGE